MFQRTYVGQIVHVRGLHAAVCGQPFSFSIASIHLCKASSSCFICICLESQTPQNGRPIASVAVHDKFPARAFACPAMREPDRFIELSKNFATFVVTYAVFLWYYTPKPKGCGPSFPFLGSGCVDASSVLGLQAWSTLLHSCQFQDSGRRM